MRWPPRRTSCSEDGSSRAVAASSPKPAPAPGGLVEGRPFTVGDRATSAITRAYVKLAAAASSPIRIQGCGGVQLQAPREGSGAPRHSAAPRSCVRAPYVSLRYRKSPDVFAACGRPMARGGASAGRSAWARPGGVTARAAWPGPRRARAAADRCAARAVRRGRVRLASAVFMESLARGTARASGEAGESDGAAVTGRARPRSRDRGVARPILAVVVPRACHW